MSEYFKQARRCFQEALQAQDPTRDPVTYNFYAGLVSLASGWDAEISALERRLEEIETQLARLK